MSKTDHHFQHFFQERQWDAGFCIACLTYKKFVALSSTEKILADQHPNA